MGFFSKVLGGGKELPRLESSHPAAARVGQVQASLEKLAGDFGDRIAFHGGIDNQHVLPFGSPDEIEEEVQACLTTLGRGSTGYILAPCHNVQANTPPQSVVHMYEMARKHGRS